MVSHPPYPGRGLTAACLGCDRLRHHRQMAPSVEPPGQQTTPLARKTRQLVPEPARAIPDLETIGAVYADGRGRPWLASNMVASVDGATTSPEGTSGGLGGPTDRALFHLLRSQADVILVGASTVRAERYGPPARAGQRIAVVSGSASFDWSSPLFTSGSAVVITTEDAPDVPVPTIRAGRGGRVALDVALREFGDAFVLCEGGPSLNGELLAKDLLDEFCITIAPKAVNGSAARIAHSTMYTPLSMRLATLLLDEDGFVFTRYLRVRDKLL